MRSAAGLRFCFPVISGFTAEQKKLEAALLHSEIDCTVELIPGISSVVYFAAKLGVSWDDAKIVSLHGNETLFIQTVDTNRKNVLSSWRKRCGRTTAERTFGVWNGRTVPFGRKRSFL